MADSTLMTDPSKMKVVDLRKELKTRGLSYVGDKAELTARLQAALNQDSQDQDDHGEIDLDSDEIDSDGVLDEDDKSQNDISLDDTISEELVLADQPPPPEPEKAIEETKPVRTLKRKITMSDSSKETKTEENQTGKKIVLHRTSVTAPAPKVEETTETKPSTEDNVTDNTVKISTNMDVKTRLEMRAKRFGLPVKMSDDQRKEVRKQRFGQSAATSGALGIGLPLEENIDKLKQRAERFGQSVSKFMTDIENREKIEKRKAKFGTVK